MRHCVNRFLVALAILAPSVAAAADVSWSAGSGSYTVGTNWATGSVPTTSDVAVIANGGTSTLTLSGSTSGARLAVGRDGSGGLVIAGSGTHTVAAPVLIGYTSSTAADAVFSNGSVLVGSGATLRIDGGSGYTLVGAGAGAVGGSGSLVIASGAEVLFNGAGDRRLVIGDTLNGNTSSGSVDISGALTVAAGEFMVGRGQGGGGTASGTVTINAGGVLTTNDWTKFGTDQYGGGAGGGNARLVMTGGTLNKLGTGRLVFGNYIGTGDVTQSGGVINVAGSSEGINIGAFGVNGVGTYTLSSGTLAVSAGMLSVGRQGGQGTFTMTGGLIQKTSPQDMEIGEGGSGSMTVTGGLVDVQAGDLAIGVWGGSGSLTIGGSGTVRAGNVVFSKNAVTPLSTLTLNAGGRLEASRITSVNANALAVVSFNGGRLVATGNQPAFMSGLANAFLDAGGATIDTQGYAVAMSQPLSGAGPLTKLGSGTLTMTGAGSFSGPTTVSEGGLVLSTAHTGGNDMTVASGATLGVIVSGSLDSQLTLSSLGLGTTSGLTIDLASFGNPSLAPLKVTGGLTTSGATTVINFATGAPSAGTVPLVSYGSLNVYNFQLGTLPVGMQATLVNNSAASRIDLLISSIPIRRWQGTLSAVWNTSTANWVSTFSGTGPSAVFANGDGPVLFTDEATGPTAVTLNQSVSPVATSFTNSVLTYSLTGTGAIAGSGGLTKSGSANVTIGTRNTYTGVTRLEGGTTSIAVIANGGTASGIGAATAAASNLVFAGGRLEYTGSTATVNRGFSLAGDGGGIAVTQSNAILTLSGSVTADSGSFVKSGAGTLRLTGSSNALGRVADGAGLVVQSGSMQLFSTVAGATNQITTVTGDVVAGGLADTPVSLALTNSTLNASGWLSLGHETGTANSTTLLTRAAITAGNLRLGYSGTTTNSGSHSLSLTNSTVTVTGETLVGNISPSIATISVQGTSAFQTGSDMNVGNTAGTQGAVTVGGTASLTVLGRLRAGDLGNGTVAASGSARLSLNQVQIGNNLTGTGTMTLADDTVATLSGYIAIGNSGSGSLSMTGRSRMSVVYDLNVADDGGSLGTMTIADRASATAGSVYLGKGDLSGGTVTISGGTLSQTNTAGEFFVGRNGNGTLNVSGSATVLASASTGILMGGGVFSQVAVINLNGGVVQATRLSKGSGVAAALTFNSGTLRAASGAVNDFVSGLTSVSVLPGGAVIDSNGQSVTFGSAITDGGGGGLTKIGSGTLALAGGNSYLGTTSVQAGTLRVDGDTSLATGALTVASGATLAGSGTVGGASTIQSGATLSPGSGPGTLAFAGGLNWNTAGNYNWQMLSGTGTAGSTSAWDVVTVGGTLAINATSVDPFRINLWTLSGVDVSGSASNFNPAQGYTWRIATAAGGISGFAANKFAIRTSATNGTGGFANSVGGGTFSVAQSGNNLNLVFTAGTPSVITINVPSGTQTQTQAGYPTLSGSTPVVKTGAGTLVVDQANTLSGSTTVQGGRVQLANASALSTSTVVPVVGGTLTLSPYLQTSVGGLAPLAGGLTDVGSGMITVAAGLSTTDMVAALLTGFGDGSWNGTSGITSSVAAASGGSRTVGWLDNGGGSVTFAFAAAGDTNLDWQVDILDSANFLSSGKLDSGLLASWIEGDFTYDGFVDVLDAAAFLSTGLLDAGPYNPPAGQAGIAAVPEPSSLAMVMVAGGLMAAGIRRVRCRRSGTR
ncbi:MAG: beta strand repeat-containing protein [Planctomycetaceae bacterium]